MSTFTDVYPQSAARHAVPTVAIRGLQTVLGTAWHAVATVNRWRETARQRRHLAALETHQLADIGISAEQARREAAKPFWID